MSVLLIGSLSLFVASPSCGGHTPWKTFVLVWRPMGQGKLGILGGVDSSKESNFRVSIYFDCIFTSSKFDGGLFKDRDNLAPAKAWYVIKYPCLLWALQTSQIDTTIKSESWRTSSARLIFGRGRMSVTNLQLEFVCF